MAQAQLPEPPARPTRLISPDGRMKAWVMVDGRELEVYGPELEAESRKSSGWIVGEVGQRYTVHLKARRPPRLQRWLHGQEYNKFSTRFWLDGILQFKKRLSFSPRQGAYGDLSLEASFLGVNVGPEVHVPMRFSAVNYSEDDAPGSSTSCETGSIKINILRARSIGAVPVPRSYVAMPIAPGLVNESEKKAQVGYVTAFAEPEACAPRTGTATSSAKYPGDLKTPYHTFEFRCTTMDLLRANGIVEDDKIIRIGEEGSQVAQAIEVEDSEDETTLARKRARRAALAAELAEIDASIESGANKDKKRKADNATNAGAKRIKLEDGLGVKVEGGVVDLTEDD